MNGRDCCPECASKALVRFEPGFGRVQIGQLDQLATATVTLPAAAVMVLGAGILGYMLGRMLGGSHG